MNRIRPRHRAAGTVLFLLYLACLIYFLFFAEDKVLDAYLALKEEQRTLLGNGGYTKQKSYELAQEFGRLLSYPEDGIERLIRKAAQEREAGDED